MSIFAWLISKIRKLYFISMHNLNACKHQKKGIDLKLIGRWQMHAAAEDMLSVGFPVHTLRPTKGDQ